MYLRFKWSDRLQDADTTSCTCMMPYRAVTCSCVRSTRRGVCNTCSWAPHYRSLLPHHIPYLGFKDQELHATFAVEIIKLLLLRSVGKVHGLPPEFCLAGKFKQQRQSLQALTKPPPGCPNAQWCMQFECNFERCSCMMTVYATSLDTEGVRVHFSGIHQHSTGTTHTLLWV